MFSRWIFSEAHGPTNLISQPYFRGNLSGLRGAFVAKDKQHFLCFGSCKSHLRFIDFIYRLPPHDHHCTFSLTIKSLGNFSFWPFTSYSHKTDERPHSSNCKGVKTKRKNSMENKRDEAQRGVVVLNRFRQFESSSQTWFRSFSRILKTIWVRWINN